MYLIDQKVLGIPEPKGSVSSFIVKGVGGKPKSIVTHSKKSKEWEKVVRTALGGSRKHVDGPFHVSLVFTLLKPKTATRSLPYVRPDLDKLVRTVLDAMTGVVFSDDSRVVSLSAIKEYGNEPGVHIVVDSIDA